MRQERLGPPGRAVSAELEGLRAEARRALGRAQRDGLCVASALQGSSPELRSIVYFGTILTAQQTADMRRLGFKFSRGGWHGRYRRIPAWAWELKRPLSERVGAKPRVKADLKWEPGKPSWP